MVMMMTLTPFVICALERSPNAWKKIGWTGDRSKNTDYSTVTIGLHTKRVLETCEDLLSLSISKRLPDKAGEKNSKEYNNNDNDNDNNALHPRDDIYRLYVSCKEGERGLASIKDSVNTSIRQLEDYIKKEQRKANYSDRNNTNNTRINRTTIVRKKWEEKQLYEYFKQQTNEISHEKTWI